MSSNPKSTIGGDAMSACFRRAAANTLATMSCFAASPELASWSLVVDLRRQAFGKVVLAVGKKGSTLHRRVRHILFWAARSYLL